MRYPKHMMLEVTARCNFRCPYCYCVWHERPELGGPDLEYGVWRGIIDKCAADGCDDILFTGGEALMRADLFRLLAYARRRMPAAKLTLFTNAALAGEETIRRLMRLKVRIATSLQGLKTYNAMTGTRRKPYRLLAFIARAAELDWPVSVSMTITKVNVAEAPDMFAAAALSGAKTIQIGPMMAAGRAMKHLDMMISKEEWEEVKSRIRSLPNARVPYTFCDEFICACRPDTPKDMLEKWNDPNRPPCPAGKAFGVIGPNGIYRTCLHSLPAGLKQEKCHSC